MRCKLDLMFVLPRHPLVLTAANVHCLPLSVRHVNPTNATRGGWCCAATQFCCGP